MNKIFFYNIDIDSRLLQKKQLKRFLLSIFEKEKKKLDRLNVIFCTDKYLIRLNRKYLDHDYYTDTITFLLSQGTDSIVGEAYLSIDRIRANAVQTNLPYQNELLRIIIHSILHLCGHTDKTKKRSMEMEKVQEKYLESWNVSRETARGG